MAFTDAGDGTGSAKFMGNFLQERPGKVDDYYRVDSNKKGLGDGSYGQVTIAKSKEKGQEDDVYAVKSIAYKDAVELKKYKGEVEIHKALDHPHIVKLYEVFQDRKQLYLVMELCTGGELFDRIVDAAEAAADSGHEGQAFNEKGAANYMNQIFGAMRYLHSHAVAHRDIKPENFLLASNAKDAPIKVIDFGLAKRFSEGTFMSTKAGTPYYVAPEVLSGAYTEKCDVWSCGVILYILLCGYPPFYGNTNPEILDMVKKGKVSFPSPDFDEVSKDGKGIINLMITLDPVKRPSFQDLIEHRWLHDHTEKKEAFLASGMTDRMKKFRSKGKFEKLALNCIARQMKDSEIEDLKRTFEALDTNNDGTLTIDEIMHGLDSAKSNVPADFLEVLKNLDTDGSGVVEYSEFIAATVNKKQFAQDSRLWQCFRTFDTDGNGQISRQELHSFLKTSDDVELNKMIQEADLNGDGLISFDEFKALMTKDA